MKYLTSQKTCDILAEHPNTLLPHLGKENTMLNHLLGTIKKLLGFVTGAKAVPNSEMISNDNSSSGFVPTQIIKDIHGSLNFKRKGLKSILGRLLDGDKFELVVAHQDRLARLGGKNFCCTKTFAS